MHRILILGPQGSGKGTQAKILAKKLGIPALSMGQMMRDEMASGSELGRKLQVSVETGVLASDEDALQVFKNRMNKDDVQGGYIIDSYPRNVAQYEMAKSVFIPTAVIVLDIPREESLSRLVKRAKLEGRTDDTPEIIDRRLGIYHAETEPMIELYRQEGLAHDISGMGTIDEIAQRISDVLGL